MNDYKYNKHVLVEDSTKGKAIVSPRSYKGDVMVQVWMDSRKLATLVKWLDDRGLFVRFMSEIVRETTDIVVDNLVEDGIVEMVEYTEDARSMLSRRFRVNLNTVDKKGNIKGGRNVHHNLVLDDRRKSQQIHQQTHQQPIQETNEPKEESIEELVVRGTKIYNEKLAKEEEEELKKQEDRIKDSYTVDEEGIVRFKGEENDKSPIGEEEKRKFDEEQERRDEEWEEEQKKKKELALSEKKEEKTNGKVEVIKERLESADIRVRSDEEILEDRARKDKEQDRLLSQM